MICNNIMKHLYYFYISNFYLNYITLGITSMCDYLLNKTLRNSLSPSLYITKAEIFFLWNICELHALPDH